MGYHAMSQRSGGHDPVVFDTQRAVNAHVMILGKSGVGKTYTIKKMLSQINAHGKVRVHVMDVHGDIDIDEASTVKFSEATPYGFNPLFVSADPHTGGVRKRVQSFISALNRTGYKLGPKQEAALRNILIDLYAANGFYADDPNSWKINDGVKRQYPKKMPTMEDAVRFARSKLRMMFLGTSAECVQTLEQLNKKQGQVAKKVRELHRLGNSPKAALDLEALKKEVSDLGDESAGLYRKHIDEMVTGHELDDLIKYDSKDVVKSVVDRLENLNSIGVFRPQRPPFDSQNPIWRYDIKALGPNEKRLFVSFMLEAIFLNASHRGIQDDVVEIIVLDEAHLFLTNDDDNPINIIAKEARKFGLGIICASQSPTHFSDDFLSNVSMKVILGIDTMWWDGATRKLKLDIKALEWIVSQKQILTQINNRGETKNDFIYTLLQDGKGNQA